jgi:signal transduction histidine kinase
MRSVRDTENAMLPRRITHQNIFRVMTAGIALVILMLGAAAAVAIRNIQAVQQTVQDMLREQQVSGRLIDELHSQQMNLSDVFGVLARDPDSVDYFHIMTQLDEADRDIARIAAEGERTPERNMWHRLNQSSLSFSAEARRLLTVEEPETYQSMDLFRSHGAFTSVVARLLDAEYRKLNAAQAEIARRTSKLSGISLGFTAAALLLALAFAAGTVRLVSQLIRRMEWQTAELGRVSWHMLENQEATARRFSHELHDELGQSLTAIKTNLSAIDGADGRIADCLHLVDDAIGNVRQMSQLLRPTILDDFGLEAGLRWLAEGFAARTGIPVEVDAGGVDRLSDEAETHLFRIAQEALTNIARHADAKHVKIHLSASPTAVRLTVRDDGRGLPMSPEGARPEDAGHLGMIGMRARARSAGGDVQVHSKPGDGVLIEVQVPLKHETNAT